MSFEQQHIARTFKVSTSFKNAILIAGMVETVATLHIVNSLATYQRAWWTVDTLLLAFQLCNGGLNSARQAIRIRWRRKGMLSICGNQLSCMKKAD